MSFEAWRRALLMRSGVFGTLQREWRRDHKSGADRVVASLDRVSRDLAALQQKIEQLNTELRSVAGRSKEHGDRLTRQSGEIEQLRSEAGMAESRAAQLQRDTARAQLALMVNAEHRERRHAGALDAPRIAAHVNARIASAAVTPEPMPHILVTDLLPGDTYEALLSAIPPPEFFSQRDPVKRNFKIGQGKLAPEWTLCAWQFFEHAVIAEMLVPALVERMRPWLPDGVHLGASAGRLMLRGPGYHLAPHLDPKGVLFTCLVYFARPGDDEAFGTQLFRLDRPLTERRENTYYPGEDGFRCELAETIPFRANTALVFLNAGGAHGAHIPTSAPPATERYAYQFYVRPTS